MDAGLHKELDDCMRRLSEATRLLPALTADNAVAERRRLIGCLQRGEMPVPSFRSASRRVDPLAERWLDRARQLAELSPAASLYLERLDELELELVMLHALGDARRIRPVSARRFGTGAQLVSTAEGERSLAQVAGDMLGVLSDTPEELDIPAESSFLGEFSVASIMRALAFSIGLEVEIRVEPRLAAAAAAGDRTVFLAARHFGLREAVRLAVHEVFGHIVSAANGRAQPLRILELGTAGSFEDQEGLAIWFEEQAGVLDGRRLRTLAARVVAADCMHSGASFGETARQLVGEHGFGCEEAILLTERAYRGGGVARDVGYLSGWLRVRQALERGDVSVDELRSGRVGLAALQAIRRLRSQGFARRPPYRPSLARSLSATAVGTSFDISPPSDAASLTRLELT